MTKKVLDVGQCNPDHSSISTLLKSNFDVEIDRAHSHDEAIKMAMDSGYDLILINRVLDADGTAGMDILNSLKSQPATAETPVMVVSNYEEAQAAAVEQGAVRGFGKAALNELETLDLVRAHLGSD